MEPEVCIVEMIMEGIYKVFKNGVTFLICTPQELFVHLGGKAHLLLLVPSEIDPVRIKRLAGRMFVEGKVNSMCVMYSAVATSFALGLPSLLSISIFSIDNSVYKCNLDIVSKSCLEYNKSRSVQGDFNGIMDEISKALESPLSRSLGIKEVYIKGTEEMRKRITGRLEEMGMLRKEDEDEYGLGIFRGYSLAALPSYFKRYMPHNMIEGSDLSYVGGVLTTMINYFEIKEVATREDFEAGSTKHLILN